MNDGWPGPFADLPKVVTGEISVELLPLVVPLVAQRHYPSLDFKPFANEFLEQDWIPVTLDPQSRPACFG